MITVRALSILVEEWCRDTGQPASWHEIVSVRRSRAICRARSLLIWLARRHTSLSLPQIGRQLGGRDHTTILYNCRVIDALIAKADPPTLAALARIEAAIAPLAEAAPPIPTSAPSAPGPHRFVAYDRLVDAVEAVLSGADAAALARGTRHAPAADLALANALASLRSARTRLLAHDARARAHEPAREPKRRVEARLSRRSETTGERAEAPGPPIEPASRGPRGPDRRHRPALDARHASAA